MTPEGGAVMTLPVWPHVVAIVPARNEAKIITASLHSLLQQDYPGRFEIVVVDDHSDDGTDSVARARRGAAGATERLVVLAAPNLAAGWTGKLWALNHGVQYIEGSPEPPAYVFFTDADISYDASALRELVARAERGGLVLTSLMAKLRCESVAERAMIPAFIFFFRMLYPFAWVNRPDMRTAAAAGGCMLIQRKALLAAGGLASVRGELIDDCALGRLLKTHGPIWLSLTNRARSLRAYPSIGDVRHMVSRAAYAQLGCSPLWLAGTVAAMTVAFLAPPLLAVGGTGDDSRPCSSNLGAHGAGTATDTSFLRCFAMVGCCLAGGRSHVPRVHAGFGVAALARQGRHVEGAHAFSGIGPVMMLTLVRFVAKALARTHGEGRSDYTWQSGDV